jgi:hypothetical protein
MSYGRSLSRIVVLLMSSLAATNCGGSTTVPLVGACTGPVTVTVTAGTTPRFDWQPACRAHFFDVQYQDPLPPGAISGLPVWFVQATGETGSTFGPGFQYGTVPNGGQSQILATPLIVGQRYVAEVWREDGPQNATIAGRAVFVP